MADREQLVQLQADKKLEGPLTELKNFGESSRAGLRGVGPTGPRQPTMPVDTQPQRVPVQQVPFARPLKDQLAALNFSPASWSVLQNLQAQYGGESRAVSSVQDGLRNVIATAGNARPESLEDSEDKYRELSGGVLFSGERFTGNHCFDFSKVEFQHILYSQQGARVTAQTKPAMTAGRIYLTNQRLILLSIRDETGLQLTDEGSQPAGEHKCVTLSITGGKTSTFRYESIQLADIRGVDMSSVFSDTSSTNVKGFIPPPPPHWFFSCCCTEEAEWKLSRHISSSTNWDGVINLGTLLPPWQTKCNVAIFMPRNSETAAGVEFIRALQCAAPALQPNPGN
ncbi:uncharacterized protein LOC117306794 [Asterias rubens]|uniref:uncharacterized protein LOC117306794 n=1 Tax=Asterias rubens TaxID=7604 RepID=UPI001455D377|nr:uncharacterized protein LOC117306794 [Asterias rubens]